LIEVATYTTGLSLRRDVGYISTTTFRYCALLNCRCFLTMSVENPNCAPPGQQFPISLTCGLSLIRCQPHILVLASVSASVSSREICFYLPFLHSTYLRCGSPRYAGISRSLAGGTFASICYLSRDAFS
jgi:hypothetical protein